MEKNDEKRKSRTRFCIKTKQEMIEKHEKGMRLVDIAREYKCNPSTISTILKQKEVLKGRTPSKGLCVISSKRSPANDEMERLLLRWIKEKEMAGEALTEAIISAKAKTIFNELVRREAGEGTSNSQPHLEFRASRGWFEKFKKRTGVHIVSRHGKAAFATQKSDDEFVKSEELVAEEGCVPPLVFNCDETELFWKDMPYHTFIIVEDKKMLDHKPMKEEVHEDFIPPPTPFPNYSLPSHLPLSSNSRSTQKVVVMSTVTSKLTTWQRKKLCSLFHNASLSLLFKASVHGYHVNSFHQKCNNQGPTVVVAYNNSGYVFGAYTSKNYAQSGLNVTDGEAFLFSFNEREPKEDPLRVTSGNPQFAFTDAGPNFGSLVFLYNNGATVQSNPVVYKFDPLQMHGNDLLLTECEVYRVEDAGQFLENPWRNVQWSAERRKVLLKTIADWKPSISSVKQARVLLVGPVGAGKSSFFNSINSIFKGYVSTQANTGTAGTSLTTQFRSYFIKASGGANYVPLTLCDSIGLEEGLHSGLDVDDFTSILNGHIKDKYQFNPSIPIQPDSLYYHKDPAMKDRIHCVVYVMDASKVMLMSDQRIEKMAHLRRKSNQLGVPQLVLLTKVDEACPLVAKDLKNIYLSRYIHTLTQEVSAQLGVSVSSVVPVKNYHQELELDPQTDTLLLSAVVQMLRLAEGYFDDQCDVCEKE